MRVSTQPTIQNTLDFCGLLLKEELLLESDNAKTWTTEVRAHLKNLENLQAVLKESEGEKMSGEISKTSYQKCVQTFGREFTEKLFKNTRVVDHCPPVDAAKLFSDIKSKSASLGVKVKQPGGFYNETAKQSFEASLFRQKNGNGYRSAKKDWPKLAVSFAELRQARVQGELSTQFQELSNNILLGSEYDAETKAKLMANLVSEYTSLVKGEK